MRIPDEFLEGEVRNSFYVENMMKKAWSAQIEVLNDIDIICRRHNIQYFADWGTLLGTVRHHGFIPWDDDMDITMKRPDYVRFCQIAQKEMPELWKGYEVINFYKEEGWTNMLSRVINGRCVDYHEDYLEKFHGFPYVAGLDIFPLDYVPNDPDEDEMQCNLIQIVGAAADMIVNPEAEEDDKKKMLKDIEEMCCTKFRDDEPYQMQLNKLSDKLCMMYNENECDRIALMYDHAGPRPADVYPKEYYSDSIRMPFEYTTIPVPIGYKEILVQKYGEDYMIPRVGGTNHEYPFYKKQEQMMYKELGLL